jgi:lysophospholipase L1-like esterase
VGDDDEAGLTPYRGLRWLVPALVALAAPQAAAAKDAVLVVGDSLEVGTGPYLRGELTGTEVAVDARIGRPSGEGVRVLGQRLRPGYRVVVFDLGVNDNPSQPGALASDLAAARRLAGKRCLVVATLERPPLAGVSVAGLNRAVESFAAGAPNVRLVDWHAAVSGRAGLLSADRVHPNPEGYALRGRLVAEGVRACLGQGGAPAPSRPPSAPAPVATPRASERPLLIDWAGLARTSPASGALSVLTGGFGTLAGAGARALATVAEGGAEPVLGNP